VAAGLMARGHRVVVSCRAGGVVARTLARSGVPTTPVRPGAYAGVVPGIRFTRWLARERPDALLLTSWRAVPWGAWAGRRAGARVVVRLGIVRALPPRGRRTWPFRRRVDALVANAGEIRDAWLRSAPWFPAERLHVVLNGIEVPPPLPDDERAGLRAGLGVSADELLVAGAGHAHPRKGFDLLLDAFACAALPASRAVIVGDGPEVQALKRRAGALGIADQVRFAGARGDVPRVLAACDVFVLSSRNEGMANVMLEAMAAGTPVVATDVSGVRAALGERFDRPAAGWIVPPDDAGAMAAALGEVAAGLRSESGEVRARVEEARWRIGRWFALERMIDETEAVLRGTPG
jgi:glycosyltransferase involved in cell wall biosynthesis